MKLINGNPRWQDAEEIGLRFLQMHISNGIEKKVNMATTTTDRELAFSCGTSACHGGWYAIYSDEYEVDGYTTGKKLMSEDLGFDNELDLKYWAHGNPNLWGNAGGYNMFSDRIGKRHPFGDFTLEDISNHWMGVAERLWEIQQ